MTAKTNDGSAPARKWHDVTVKIKAPSAREKLLRELSISFTEEDDERKAYIRALIAVGGYLSANNAGRDAFKMLELASALSDLNDGIVWPVLHHAPIKGGAVVPSNIWRRRAFVALGIAALRRGGLSRKEAAQEAARTVKTIRALNNDKTNPGNAALSWHDELSKGRIKNYEGVHTFKAGCRALGRAMGHAAHEPTALKDLAASWFSLADLA